MHLFSFGFYSISGACAVFDHGNAMEKCFCFYVIKSEPPYWLYAGVQYNTESAVSVTL